VQGFLKAMADLDQARIKTASWAFARPQNHCAELTAAQHDSSSRLCMNAGGEDY
jgi:hypothetical protein